VALELFTEQVSEDLAAGDRGTTQRYQGRALPLQKQEEIVESFVADALAELDG
jgi:hypothetical protein